MISPETVTPTQEVTISRVFAAPRELVSQVWTDPRHKLSWWRPALFITPGRELDPGLGGADLAMA